MPNLPVQPPTSTLIRFCILPATFYLFQAKSSLNKVQFPPSFEAHILLSFHYEDLTWDSEFWSWDPQWYCLVPSYLLFTPSLKLRCLNVKSKLICGSSLIGHLTVFFFLLRVVDSQVKSD